MAKLSREYLELLYYRLLHIWDSLEAEYIKLINKWLRGIETALYVIVDDNDLMDLLQAAAYISALDGFWQEQEEELKERARPIYIDVIRRTEPVIEPMVEPHRPPEEPPAPVTFVQPDPYAQFDPVGPIVPWPTVPNPASRADMMQTYLENRISNIKGITDTVKKDIVDAMRREGATEESVKEAIKKAMRIENDARATIIAKTELAAMSNDATIATFLENGVTEISWFSQMDGKVRPSHRIDGETVKIGQVFSNGLLYPHDPGGPPEQTIGCRCWIVAKEPE